MISEILNKMMLYADTLSEQNRRQSAKVVDDCIAIVHQVYYHYADYKIDVGKDTYIPKTDIETLVLTIPGIKVFEDKGIRTYELDVLHFDTEIEVIQYLIKDRKNAQSNARTHARKQMFEYMAEEIHKLKASTINKKFDESKWLSKNIVVTQVVENKDEEGEEKVYE